MKTSSENSNSTPWMRELASRRRRVMRRVGSDSVVCLYAAPKRCHSNDVDYAYRQDSNFAYLTGLSEDRIIAMLAPGCEYGDYIVFCAQSNLNEATWEGARISSADIVRDYGADAVFPLHSFAKFLPQILQGRRRLYFDTGDVKHFSYLAAECTRLRRNRHWGKQVPDEFVDLMPLLGALRLRKSPLERRLMRKAVAIAVGAHRSAWQVCRPGVHEYEVAAELQREFLRHDARPAFLPIVAGGANACVLHYTENRDVLRQGDLLLVDCGAEYKWYASDVTRTVPVSGRFTPAQRALYEAVLEAQAQAIAQMVIGNSWRDVHDAAVKSLTGSLRSLSLLRGNLDKLIEKGACRKFFMHGTGHWLGMDVHDTSPYHDEQGHAISFKEGMIGTAEPGLYVRPDAKVARRWWNTGIRIEDDVLITRDGPKVLSADLPKTPDAIETAMMDG